MGAGVEPPVTPACRRARSGRRVERAPWGSAQPPRARRGLGLPGPIATQALQASPAPIAAAIRTGGHPAGQWPLEWRVPRALVGPGGPLSGVARLAGRLDPRVLAVQVLPGSGATGGRAASLRVLLEDHRSVRVCVRSRPR